MNATSVRETASMESWCFWQERTRTQELEDKFNRGELEHKRGGYAVIDPRTGRPFVDENPVVF